MKQSIRVLAAVFAMTAAPAAARAQITPSTAQDQVWLRDRRYTEGIGFRVGDFELHPGVGAEFGYDSNFFRRSSTENDGPVGALRLRVTPSFSVSSLSPQRREAGGPPPDVEFRGTVSATYHEFFPVSGSERGKALMSEQRNVSGDLDLNLGILPGRTWSGNLTAGVSRAITPANEGITSVNFRRVMPRAGGELIFTPGGGLLDWRLGYQFSAALFESDSFGQLTNLQHQIQTRGRWRFLPRTALMYDARLGFVTYPNPSEKTASHPLRTLIGVNGLITSSFSVMAMVGWGASFYSTGPQIPIAEDFNSVIGRLELKWYLSATPPSDPANAPSSMSSVSAGFSRDFYDSYIGTYFELDRGYVNLSYFFANRFLLVFDGGAGPVVFPQVRSLNLQPWTDIRVDAALLGEYRIKDQIGINATVRYNQNFSPTAVVVAGQRDELKWQQIEAYLGVRWFM